MVSRGLDERGLTGRPSVNATSLSGYSYSLGYTSHVNLIGCNQSSIGKSSRADDFRLVLVRGCQNPRDGWAGSNT